MVRERKRECKDLGYPGTAIRLVNKGNERREKDKENDERKVLFGRRRERKTWRHEFKDIVSIH